MRLDTLITQRSKYVFNQVDVCEEKIKLRFNIRWVGMADIVKVLSHHVGIAN